MFCFFVCSVKELKREVGLDQRWPISEPLRELRQLKFKTLCVT